MEPQSITVKINDQHVAVKGLYHHSQQVQPGGMFFALKDGTYIDEAIANGATAVVTAADVIVQNHAVKHFAVSDVRETMALVAKQFYGNVADKMRITGVVGTNGKTTTSYMVRHILETDTGKNVGLIGTTGIWGAGQGWNSVITLTTPDPIDLHRALWSMYQNGVRDVVMEVSAHAIYYRKVAGINFQGVIFTNITPDHLDFFHDFETYKETKLGFFRGLVSGIVVINADDQYGLAVADAVRNQPDVQAVSYTLKTDSIVGTNVWAFVDNVCLGRTESDFDIGKVGTCNLHMAGLYNVYNAVGAALLCNQYGVAWPIIKDALHSLPAVPGRFNTRDVHGITTIIDYAHTPDGLEKLLENARLLVPRRHKLWVVFGCGGDRDTTKRPVMGALAYRLADRIVITSDNPRTEDPDAIIETIVAGITALPRVNPRKYCCVTDRTAAITWALEAAQVGDVVVIAGKGHENYLDVNGQKIPYMDAKVIDNILRG